MGEFRGGGRTQSGGKTTDKIYDRQMKDASSGRQRFFDRASDNIPPSK